MVDFSNIFILFTYLREWLASLGLSLSPGALLMLIVFLWLALISALVGLVKKDRSDANRYNMKKFFLAAAGIFLAAARVAGFAMVWPGVSACFGFTTPSFTSLRACSRPSPR